MPRPLSDQVVVITGASSGIGRETALRLGAQGASLVLAARNEDALASLAREIEQAGGTAQVVPTDVTDWQQVQLLAETAVERFGRIDTWVNNAALYLASRVEDMQVEDATRLFDVSVFGLIYGVKAALPYLVREGQGTIINVSSVNGVRAFPLLAVYSSAKHAVQGFTDGLRIELARDHPGIKVVAILPASVNTPFFIHARSRLGVAPHPIPPIYDVGIVADAIVLATQRPRRDIYIGPGRLLAMAHGIMPGVVDRVMLTGDLAFRLQKSDEPDTGRDNFDAPMPLDTYTTTGRWGDQALPRSLYTELMELSTSRRLAVLGTVLASGIALARALRR